MHSKGSRAPVTKTYKLWIGGAFVRSEGGHVFRHESEDGFVDLPRATRKDLRDAVVAARAAAGGWARRSAFNRGQVLFRIAEMMEGRREELARASGKATGRSLDDARAELEQAIDAAFSYAGWTDKLTQVLGSQNPVAAPFQNVTSAEPVGVVVVAPGANEPLRDLVEALLPPLAAACTCVLLAHGAAAPVALELGEVLATSDVPDGVANLLSAESPAILEDAAAHLDVDGVAVWGADEELRRSLTEAGAENVKRLAFPKTGSAAASPYLVESFVEWKTTWFPIGT